MNSHDISEELFVALLLLVGPPLSGPPQADPLPKWREYIEWRNITYWHIACSLSVEPDRRWPVLGEFERWLVRNQRVGEAENDRCEKV